MARVLIVDDSELILQMLSMVVSGAGHEVVTAVAWSDAVSAFQAQAPDVVVTDLNLPDQPDPLAALAELGAVPVIIVSGRPQAELDDLARQRGAAGAVSKDAGLPGLAAALPALLSTLA